MKRPTEDQAIMGGIIIVFLFAAAHNYTALQDFSFKSGVPYFLSFTTPLMFDFFVGIAVWVTLRNKRLGEQARLGWTIVIVFTLVSITLNLMHYPLIPGGIAMAVIVPLVTFFAAELGKGLQESARNRQDAVASLAELSFMKDTLTADLDKLNGQIKKAQDTLDSLNEQIHVTDAHLSMTDAHLTKANEAKLTKVAERRQSVLSLLQSGLSPDDIAGQMEVSIRTIKRDILALNGQVRMTQ